LVVTRQPCDYFAMNPSAIDLHKLAAERSLAYHRVIAARLLQDRQILNSARQRVEQWMSETPDRPYVRRWEEILGREPSMVAAFLVETSAFAEELRQSSPFSGVLDYRERWRIWRETRAAFERKR